MARSLEILGEVLETFGKVFGYLVMSNTDTKKAIFFEEGKMCPQCTTVVNFRRWPNLGSGSKTAPAPALKGPGAFLI